MFLFLSFFDVPVFSSDLVGPLNCPSISDPKDPAVLSRVLTPGQECFDAWNETIALPAF